MTSAETDVRLVVFDLGRVLIRLWDGWEHACAAAGILLPPERAQLSAETLAVIEEISARYDTGMIDADRFAREIAPHRGLEAADIIKLVHLVLRDPFPGVEALLDDLHDAGIDTACLSNTCEPHWSMMLTPGGAHSLPLHRLKHRFASHLLGLRKPDARIYEHVERETGYRGSQIVFFDDLAANVDAATERGWLGCRIQTDEPMTEARQHLAAIGAL